MYQIHTDGRRIQESAGEYLNRNPHGTNGLKPGMVYDNGLQVRIEGVVKSGGGHSVLVRINSTPESMSKCGMTAAGNFPRELVGECRGLPHVHKIRSLASERSKEDLRALKSTPNLESLRCVLIAKQRGSASRVIVLGHLDGDKDQVLRQYWKTNLKRAFPKDAERWIEKLWMSAERAITYREANRCVSPIRKSQGNALVGRPAHDFVRCESMRMPLMRNTAAAAAAPPPSGAAVSLESLSGSRKEETLQSCPRNMAPKSRWSTESPPKCSAIMGGHTPFITTMPSDIMSMILANLMNTDLPLDASHQKDLFNVLNVSQHVRAEAIAAIPRKMRRVVAKLWIRTGDDRRAMVPPKSLLQGLRHIKLDFSALDHSTDDSELSTLSPQVETLANIWKESHALESMSILVPPDPSHLFKEDPPRWEPHRDFAEALLPISDIFGSKLIWEPHDFGSPIFPLQISSLEFAASTEIHGHVLKTMLSIYIGDLNKTRACFGYNALHFAVATSRLDNARALLTMESLNVDTPDSLVQNTPLMNAAQNGDVEMVKLLLDEGHANRTLKNRDGWTALELAEENNHHSVALLLRN